MEADGVFLTEKDSVQFEKVIGELNELLWKIEHSRKHATKCNVLIC
jgi:hypothetical protein